MYSDFIGEIAGLGAAFAWAVGTVLFRRLGATIPPLALNLYKGVTAIAILSCVLALRSEGWSDVDGYSFGLLIVSGVIGIGIGDTAFFASLNRLGERRTVLMAETLAPPIAMLIALATLSEVLHFTAFIGIAITISGVAWVIVEQTSQTSANASELKSGIAYGLLAALCQAIGAVLSRAALTQSEVGPLMSSIIRIIGGLCILLVWMPLTGNAYIPQSVRIEKPWRAILLATLTGTCVGIFLQQLSLQHTQAGIAQTLIATSSLFILPLVAIRGEAISLRACIGAVIAIIGVALLFLAG
jgi:drug/metabolite transporter (DMT)-like permease